VDLLEKINDQLFTDKQLQVFVLRLDKLHPLTGGNKHFKLKYNFQEAKEQNYSCILSFGGAYSNHIAALAAAAKAEGLRSVGVIRGDELRDDANPTLKAAAANGMQFLFETREGYRDKYSPKFIDTLKNNYGDFFMVPEGGSNAHAVKGCMEIKDLIPIPFDHVILACGTGCTIAGLALSLEAQQEAIGIPVLKGAEFLEQDIRQLQLEYSETYNDKILLKMPRLIHAYHFGGYAKSTKALEDFKNNFEQTTQIPLDKIYTVKTFFALYDLAAKDHFPPGKTIVIIHTGGLQGN
jgi:1-aminocyclopropane-1-carboxylate deaminase